MTPELKYFLPCQRAWIRDSSPLKIMAKSRQIGISCAGAYHSARIASTKSTISTRNDKSPTAVERAGVRANRTRDHKRLRMYRNLIVAVLEACANRQAAGSAEMDAKIGVVTGT